MATSRQPTSKDTPQYPGSGRPHVAQLGQFVPAAPGQPVAHSARTVAPEGSPVRHVHVPPSAARPEAILFREGAFKDQADYERTSKRIAARIKRGEIPVRKPDGQ
ncbi:hypothetical protein [uncultured Hymenobacter sp.]|uniref:hypothetical protein n=1 Tax=uncultured Hymenobacter sp. TaxID=170016 RepID=UPI0035CA3640